MIDDLISRLVKMQPTEDDWATANRVVLDVIEAPPRKLTITSLVFYAYMRGVMQERARRNEKAAYGRGHVADGEAQDLPQKKSEQFQYIPPSSPRKETKQEEWSMSADVPAILTNIFLRWKSGSSKSDGMNTGRTTAPQGGWTMKHEHDWDTDGMTDTELDAVHEIVKTAAAGFSTYVDILASAAIRAYRYGKEQGAKGGIQ